MIPSAPCSICEDTSHSASKCPELSSNRTPPPQRGGGGGDEDDHLRITTSSGKEVAQEFSQTSGSRAGHWNPRSVISM